MTSVKKLNRKLINKSELAREAGISSQYVGLLLAGKRKSEKYEKLILEILERNSINKKQVKAA